MMYRIKINKMQFHSHIGVFQAEKELGQRIEIDLGVTMTTPYQGDQLDDTVSYAEFYQVVAQLVNRSRVNLVVAQLVNRSRVNLVETLAHDIIQAIHQLDAKRIGLVQVNVRKIAVPIDGIFENVEIEMEG